MEVLNLIDTNQPGIEEKCYRDRYDRMRTQRHNIISDQDNFKLTLCVEFVMGTWLLL